MPDIIRHAVRAILVDVASERLLLIRARAPDDAGDLWLTPGGGREAGESDADALRRELWEETGHEVVGAAPLLWTRRHTYRFRNREIEQHERFYWVPTFPFEPTARHNPADQEMSVFRGFRWWNLGAIEASRETFVPGRIAASVRGVLHRGLPTAPFDVDR